MTRDQWKENFLEQYRAYSLERLNKEIKPFGLQIRAHGFSSTGESSYKTFYFMRDSEGRETNSKDSPVEALQEYLKRIKEEDYDWWD